MSAVDDGADAELRALQARAYGPDADIAEDPGALARLRELEAAADRAVGEAATTAALPPPPGVEEPTPAIASDPPAPAVPVEPPRPPADSRPDVGVPAAVEASEVRPNSSLRRLLRRPRIVVGWLASLVAVAVVVALATSAIAAGTARSTAQPASAQHIATLEIDPRFEAPYSFNDTSVELIGFQEFHGLTAIAGRRWLNASSDDLCMLVASTGGLYGDTNIVSGATAYGCQAGAFPATALLRVDNDSPRELREVFADGTGLQFVLDGKRIEVYADHAPTAAPTMNATPRRPRPTPTALAIPGKVAGELARGVFTRDTSDGAKNVSEVSAAPRAGTSYALEAACTADSRGVVMEYALRTTDPTPSTLESGSVDCNGPPTSLVGELVTDSPPQVVFTATDGVREGYAIVVPTLTD